MRCVCGVKQRAFIEDAVCSGGWPPAHPPCPSCQAQSFLPPFSLFFFQEPFRTSGRRGWRTKCRGGFFTLARLHHPPAPHYIPPLFPFSTFFKKERGVKKTCEKNQSAKKFTPKNVGGVVFDGGARRRRFLDASPKANHTFFFFLLPRARALCPAPTRLTHPLCCALSVSAHGTPALAVCLARWPPAFRESQKVDLRLPAGPTRPPRASARVLPPPARARHWSAIDLGSGVG